MPIKWNDLKHKASSAAREQLKREAQAELQPSALTSFARPVSKPKSQ